MFNVHFHCYISVTFAVHSRKTVSVCIVFNNTVRISHCCKLTLYRLVLRLHLGTSILQLHLVSNILRILTYKNGSSLQHSMWRILSCIIWCHPQAACILRVQLSLSSYISLAIPQSIGDVWSGHTYIAFILSLWTIYDLKS